MKPFGGRNLSPSSKLTSLSELSRNKEKLPMSFGGIEKSTKRKEMKINLLELKEVKGGRFMYRLRNFDGLL